MFHLAAVPVSFLLFVFSCYHHSCAGIGGVTVLANSIQVKMNDCFAVVLSPDQFCNLVSCIVLQADTAEKAGGRKEMPVYAGTMLLLHHEGIEYYSFIDEHPLSSTAAFLVSKHFPRRILLVLKKGKRQVQPQFQM